MNRPGRRLSIVRFGVGAVGLESYVVIGLARHRNSLLPDTIIKALFSSSGVFNNDNCKLNLSYEYNENLDICVNDLRR